MSTLIDNLADDLISKIAHAHNAGAYAFFFLRNGNCDQSTHSGSPSPKIHRIRLELV